MGRNPQTGHRHKHSLGKNRNGRSTTGCHQVGVSHCPSGQHEHVHGSLDCHPLGSPTKNASGTHSGWVDHCADGYHSHEHAGSCHAADPPYYKGVKVEKIEIAAGHVCYTTNTEAHGKVKSCSRIPPDENSLTERGKKALKDAGFELSTLLLCAAAGPLALKCGGIVIAAGVIGNILCLQPWCDDEEPLPIIGDDTRKPPPTTTTTQQPTTTQPPTTTTEVPKKVTWDDIFKKRDEWRAGKATHDEVSDLVDLWLCQNGAPEYCT